MSKTRDLAANPRRSRHSWQVWAMLVMVLLPALMLRLWQLDDVPPGFTHDEAGHGHDAVTILEGARPIYQRVGYGREPLYDYIVAGVMGLTGLRAEALRLTSVLLGTGALAVMYLWARSAFGQAPALAAIAFQAASFWGLSTSRQSLRSGLLPLLFTACVYCYWRAVQGLGEEPAGGAQSGPRRLWMVAFALLVGATLYSYLPARLLWLIFPVFVGYLAATHHPLFRRLWRATLAFLVLGLLVSAPMFIYLALNPGVEQRLSDLWVTVAGPQAGNLLSLVETAIAGLAGFVIPGAGDQFLAYSIPGRPFLDSVTGLLALAGVVLCLKRWRQPSYAFVLIWFTIAIVPLLLTGATASSTRSIAALPVLYVFPALAATACAQTASARWGARGRQLVWVAVVALVLITGFFTVRDYF
ncbi:MAG: hypothetical protein E3J64_03585, partial [Anaerolineales bacterium]